MEEVAAVEAGVEVDVVVEVAVLRVPVEGFPLGGRRVSQLLQPELSAATVRLVRLLQRDLPGAVAQPPLAAGGATCKSGSPTTA